MSQKNDEDAKEYSLIIRYRSTTESPCRWAVFYLVSAVLATLRPLTADLGWRISLALVVYLTGLITQQNVTATEIATQVGLVSHDTLRRMLAGLGITISLGLTLSVRLIVALGGEQGWIAIDDVLLPKPFAKALALCFWDYDHAARRNCFGQRLVFIVWSNGTLVIPLLFAVWQKDPTRKPRGRKKRRRQVQKPQAKKGTRKRRRRARKTVGKRRLRLASGARYRTKNELARLMIRRLMRRGLPVQYVLFDNWYAAEDNFRLFERLGLKWVTRTKSNYKLNDEGQSLTAKKIAESVKKANYHYYPSLSARARSFAVKRGERQLKLTVIKDDRGPEGGRTKYLLTNATALECCQVIAWYRRRWMIEVFFRDCKQYLGLGRCEARLSEEIIGHLALVCVAYTILQLLRPVTDKPRPSVRANKHHLAPLMIVVLPTGQRTAQRPLPNGKMKEVVLDHLLEPVRTRLPSLTLTENLVFT